jgi:hypothetical protein
MVGAAAGAGAGESFGPGAEVVGEAADGGGVAGASEVDGAEVVVPLVPE